MLDQIELSQALKTLFDMDDADAREISETVLDAFGGDDEIPDDGLDQDLRSIFYTLEAKKLLAFRREDYSTETGERRRAFYWRVRADVIGSMDAAKGGVTETDVYAALPSSVWARQNRAA